MNKTFISGAVLALLGSGALAQSSVTIFGGMDAMAGSYKTAAGSIKKLSAGGLYTPRLGFRGVEDLGGGLRGSFWLEAQIATDTGTGSVSNTTNTAAGVTASGGGLTWNRRSTVSLHTGDLEVRLGRDYTPSFWNLTIFDPFGTIGVAGASSLNFQGTSGPTVNLVRSSNSVGVLYNAANPVGSVGFYAQAQVAAGEGAATGGRYSGLRAGYATKTLNVAVAHGKTLNTTVGDMTVTNAGASIKLGAATLSGNYSINDSGVAGTEHKTWLVGVLLPVGVSEIRASFVSIERNNAAGSSATQFGVGYAYHLSKRTALYGAAARINNKNGASFFVNGGGAAAPNAASSGYEAGIKHTF